MSQSILLKRALKGLAGLLILLNAVVLVLSLSLITRNAKALEEVHSEIVELKAKVEEEIKLREELFSTLRKSASLLQKYNPQLDDLTAYKYACKIYECSEPPVTPELLTALIVVESSANHIAISHKGAIGLTQVMPTIWKYETHELLNPYRNIEIGSKILKKYIDRHGVKGGLSSYNSGRKNRALRYAHYVLTVAENL
jgi:soluble lytic murein transglycosylase-like protein